MKRALSKRPLIHFLFVLALMAGLAPMAVSADNHEASRTEATFTSVVVEIVDPGEEWVDDAGLFHIRGQIEHDEVSGDIEGTAVIVVNVDATPLGECTEEACPSYVEVWGSVKVTGEDGWWDGRFFQSFSDAPDDEHAFSSVALFGRGGYAGMSFFGEFVEETETSVTAEGTLSTMARPTEALNVTATVCATEAEWTGNYLGTGAVDGFGHAAGFFRGAGSAWTHTYNVSGLVELSDADGSVLIGFVSGAKDVATQTTFTSHAFGNFVILGGSGAYADLYGHGRIIGAATNGLECETGFGARLSFIGEAHHN